MDLTINVKVMTLRDEHTGEEYVIDTVQTAKEISEMVMAMESAALARKVNELKELLGSHQVCAGEQLKKEAAVEW